MIPTPTLEDTAWGGILQCSLYQAFSPFHAFLQTDVALIADDEVIDQFNVQLAACLYQLLCYGDIFGRGCRVAAGVVMTDDDTWTVTDDGGSIDFGGA